MSKTIFLLLSQGACDQTSNQVGSQGGPQAFWEKLVKGSDLVNFLQKKRDVEIGPT